MAADFDSDGDEQDQAEAFDEDNTNPQERGPGEEAEQAEDLVDVFDVTSASGDEDDDAALIGDDMDDEDIVALETDTDADDQDLEDDDLARRDETTYDREEALHSAADVGEEDPDDVDGIDRRGSEEVELEYVGDMTDLEGARSAAQSLESNTLSDRDLRELDYKDEFTVDEEDEDAPPE